MRVLARTPAPLPHQVLGFRGWGSVSQQAMGRPFAGQGHQGAQQAAGDRRATAAAPPRTRPCQPTARLWSSLCRARAAVQNPPTPPNPPPPQQRARQVFRQRRRPLAEGLFRRRSRTHQQPQPRASATCERPAWDGADRRIGSDRRIWWDRNSPRPCAGGHRPACGAMCPPLQRSTALSHPLLLPMPLQRLRLALAHCLLSYPHSEKRTAPVERERTARIVGRRARASRCCWMPGRAAAAADPPSLGAAERAPRAAASAACSAASGPLCSATSWQKRRRCGA